MMKSDMPANGMEYARGCLNVPGATPLINDGGTEAPNARG